MSPLGPLYLLDTNITSGVIRGTLPGVDIRLQALALDRWCISAITRSEQRFGVELAPLATRRAKAVATFLEFAPVAAWDKAAADAHARLRATLQRAGTPIGVYDTMIAAHALVLGAVLVTRDSDFKRVPGLLLDDWADAADTRSPP